MKKITILASIIIFSFCAHAQNLTLRSNLPYPADELANIGGYVDAFGSEYALVGTTSGLSIVDVTDPVNPVEKFLVAGPNSIWREVKTWLNYAYVTTEGGSGLQIINLQYLPDSVQSTQWTGDAAITGTLNSIHALHIDNGFVYLFGTNLFSGAAVICDLNADPWNPHYLGHTPGPYVHDGYVRNDTLWAGHIYDGYFGVYNCANKANPVFLASQNTPGLFTHNTWLSADSKTLFTTDEINDSYLTSFDVSNLTLIKQLEKVQPTPGSGSIVHNTQIINVGGADFAVTSWYKDGVVIHDVSRPGNMIEIARYDTYPQGAGAGYGGCWGVYPFLPSGNIVASDIDNGLFVLTPNYIRACYLEGIVTDSITTIPLNNVSVKIISTTVTANTDVTGNYKTGLITAGNYDVEFSEPGYITKTITNVALTNGILTQLDVQLAPFSVAGQVVDAISGNPVPNANVKIENLNSSVILTTDVTGNFSTAAVSSGNSEISAGKWMYKSKCQNYSLPYAGPIIIALDPGYYDDFTFDFNWTVTGNAVAGSWTRGDPLGTYYNGTTINPDSDAIDDCSDFCYITGNNGGSFQDDDLDDGYTQLTSPVFDLTSYADPYINYERWFVDLGANAVNADTLFVRLSNGTTVSDIEVVTYLTPGSSSWVNHSARVLDYMTPSASMQLTVFAEDKTGSGNPMECGLDKFQVSEGPTGISEDIEATNAGLLYPNPFSDQIKINNQNLKIKKIELFDISGRIVFKENINPSRQNIIINTSAVQKGIYLLTVTNADGNYTSAKALKVQ